MGSGRSRGKARLPLPSQQGGALGEMDLLSQFSDSQPSKSSYGLEIAIKNIFHYRDGNFNAEELEN